MHIHSHTLIYLIHYRHSLGGERESELPFKTLKIEEATYLKYFSCYRFGNWHQFCQLYHLETISFQTYGAISTNFTSFTKWHVAVGRLKGLYGIGLTIHKNQNCFGSTNFIVTGYCLKKIRNTVESIECRAVLTNSFHRWREHGGQWVLWQRHLVTFQMVSSKEKCQLINLQFPSLKGI